jgi:hypothetical protein
VGQNLVAQYTSVVQQSKDRLRPHMVLRGRKTTLQEFGWEVIDYPACSPGLSLSDFHLFPTLMKFMGCRRFKSNGEVKDAPKKWLN